MRGTPNRYRIVFATPGIIPAYAGNTSRTTRTAHGSRDHPRVCGEHIGKTFTVGTAMGSSPRMRGTLDGHWGDARAAGIIPAYAGNTALSAGVVGGVGDHPRVCGEHARRVMALTPAEGSSPRMRGTRTTGHGLDASRRIIPAYAGNTTNLGRTLTLDGDHPRVCGEHLCTVRWSMQVVGSSPRMRGTPIVDTEVVYEFGIIPAYAGNTQ